MTSGSADVLNQQQSTGYGLLSTVGRLLLMGVVGGGAVGGAFAIVAAGFLGAVFGAIVGMFLGVASQVLNAGLVAVLVVSRRRPHPVAVSVIPVALAIAVSLIFVLPGMRADQPALAVYVVATAILSVLIAAGTVSWCLRPVRAIRRVSFPAKVGPNP